jgi:hypothetical protein
MMAEYMLPVAWQLHWMLDKTFWACGSKRFGADVT